LFALKVLMMVRRYKRAKLGNWEPALRFTTGSGKSATTVLQQSAQGADDAGKIGAFLVWYNS